MKKTYVFIGLFSIIFAHSKETVYVTILVHGTTRPYVNIQNFRSIADQECVENSPYATINNFVRDKCFSSKTQPLQELGLKKINLKDRSKGNGSGAFANTLDYMTKKVDPEAKHIYFTFGWSGLLSSKSRLKSAYQLCRAIRKIQREARIQNKKVYFRLIGYSHGGTVILNLAKIRRARKITINEMITYGMPVQKDTDYLVNSNIFKRIYHFYSPSDYVQALDLVSSEYFFCHRTFQSRKDFKVPKKLIQIKIHVTHNQMADCACNNKKCGHKKVIYKQFNRNPGHSELWNFGWASKGYRKNFPMNPFPVAVFSPIFINKINETGSRYNHFIIDVKPKQDKIEVMENGSRNKKVCMYPFVPESELNTLKEDLYRHYKPEDDLEKEKSELYKQAVAHANRIHNPCGSKEEMCQCI